MTICIATDAFPPHQSGIATHNAYLVKLLQEAGHTVIVLTTDFRNTKGPDSIEKKEGVTVVTLRDSYKKQYAYFSNFIRSGSREAVVWLSLGMAMRGWLLENQAAFDFEIIECSDYGGLGIFCSDPALPPVVIMCHSMLSQLSQHEFYNPDENLAVIRFLETNAIRQADAVICHSHSNAAELEAVYHRKICYAPAAWITEPVQLAALPGIPFLVASRLQVCKGAIVLAEAMQLLQTTHPDIKVTWVGEDTYTAPGGWLVSKYLKKNYPAVWQKTLLWKKAIPRKELLDTLSKTEVLLIPSAWETFNYVALEAASLKKAMIITRQAGVSSLFEEGKETRLADADQVQTLADAITELKGNKDLIRTLGENAFQSLERNFSREKIITGRMEAYAAAMQYRKEHPPVNPLSAFFQP